MIKNIQDTEAFINILTYPSVDAVTIATFPSSLRLTAAEELILIALKAPKRKDRSVIFQAFYLGFRIGLETSSSSFPYLTPPLTPLVTSLFLPIPTNPIPSENVANLLTGHVRRCPIIFIQ